jgi:hypothetical protein
MLAFALVLLRQPHALVRPQFVWEETAAFWAASFVMTPLSYLVEPWAGYLQVLPRAAFLVARLGPAELAPVVTLAIHAAVVAVVAAVLASDRMATAIPDPRGRLAFGVSIAALFVWEPFVSVLSAQWFLAILAVALAITPPRRVDHLILIVAGSSGIAPVLAAPLFFRSWRPGSAVDRRGLTLVAVGAVQAVVLLGSDRDTAWDVASLFPALALAVVIGSISVAPRLAVPVDTRTSVAFLAAFTLVVGALAMGVSGRYLLASTAFASLVAVSLLLEGPRLRRQMTAALTLVVLVATLPIPAPEDDDWASKSGCIGSSRACLVTVTPVEWSVDWGPSWKPPSGMDVHGKPIY